MANRLSFVEMVVPYGDPNAPHYRKNAFDAGEDGLGKNAHSLKKVVVREIFIMLRVLVIFFSLNSFAVIPILMTLWIHPKVILYDTTFFIVGLRLFRLYQIL